MNRYYHDTIKLLLNKNDRNNRNNNSFHILPS